MEQNGKKFSLLSLNSKTINIVDIFKIFDDKIKLNQTVKNEDEITPVRDAVYKIE